MNNHIFRQVNFLHNPRNLSISFYGPTLITKNYLSDFKISNASLASSSIFE